VPAPFSLEEKYQHIFIIQAVWELFFVKNQTKFV
jgi:hypothetical protein